MSQLRGFVRRPCTTCGIRFWMKKTEIRRKGTSACYCSRECYRNGPKITTEEVFKRYLSPPNEFGCILWTGGSNPNGYGCINIQRDGRKVIRHAHRIAWELTHGDILDDLHVLHRCDIYYDVSDPVYRLCVNVEHLFLGTHMDNMQDKVNKGRQVKGETSNLSKITEADVKAIRLLYRTGRRKQRELARMFNIGIPNVSAIVNYRSWKHVE